MMKTKETSIKFGLKQKTIDLINSVFAKYPQIEKVILYGSRAKGNFKTGSDIDLTMVGDDLTTQIQMDVFDELDELMLPYKMDLSIFAKLNNENLREHIERVGVVFYNGELLMVNGKLKKGEIVVNGELSMVNAKLKKDWEVKKLGEVVEIKPPKIEARTKLKPNDKVSFVPMENLGIDQKIFKPIQERTLSEVEGSYTYFADNDVLLAKITPCFENGKLGIAKNLRNGIGFGSSEYLVFRTGESLFNEFLYYFLSQEEFRINGARNMSGAVGHKRVTKDFIDNTQIPIPPLPEQQRIVATLDKAFAAIAKAKANAERNLKNAKELFESYLQSVFEKPKATWEVCNLETYIKLIDYRGRTPVKTESGVRLITAKNVKLGYLQLEPQEFIAANNYNIWMSRGIPNFGDVIFTTEAPLANVAQIDTTEKLAFAQRIIVMQPNPSKLNQTFLKYMLLSNPIRNKILGKGTGATVLGIKSSLLKKIGIYFPMSIDEQQTIVKKLDALSSETKKLEAIYQQKINDLDELKKSILQKAFTGEL